MVEAVDSEKHTNLLWVDDNYGRKKFYSRDGRCASSPTKSN